MKVISHDDIMKLNISPSCCFNWVSNVILHKAESILPAKTHISLPGDSFCNIMPSIVRLSDMNNTIGGVKIVSRYPGRNPSLDSKLLLFNADSGDFLAFMDANWITAMRTGAVAVHSVVNLAKKPFNTISIIGLGNTARAFMLVISAMFSDVPLTVKLLKYKNHDKVFIERFSQLNNINFVVVDSIEEAIRGSDVIVSCVTYFENDIAKDEWFDEGVLVVPVHTRGFTNCDTFFDKVFADDTGHVDHFKNFYKFKYYSEMTDVVNGVSVGRENNQERILAYNIGISLHDVFFAAKIYEMLIDDDSSYKALQDVELNEPLEKYWV